MSRTLKRLAVLGTLLLTASAHAAPPCSSGKQLGFQLSLSPENASLRARIERHLTVVLASRSLELCRPEGDHTGDAGRLEVALRSEAGRSHTQIKIHDALTDKQLERSLDLSALPADGRALAIAAAADELLRASWAELLLHAPAPAAPRALITVATRALPAARPTFELGLEGGAELRARRDAALLSLRAAGWLTSHWALAVRLGGSLGDRRSAAHGSVRADGIHLGVAGSYAPWPVSARLGLALEAGTSLSLLWFSARANAAGEADSFTRGAWLLDGRVRAWWGAPRLRGVLSAGLSWAARAARALDEARVVTATDGFGAELTIGVARVF